VSASRGAQFCQSHFLFLTAFYLNRPGVQGLVEKSNMVSGFFVVGAKSGKVIFSEHLPQALKRLYASATKLRYDSWPSCLILQGWLISRQTHIRGALTNGYEWIFIILSVNPNGGASYRASIPQSAAPVQEGDQITIHKTQPDLIAGILTSWVRDQLLLAVFYVLILLDWT